MSRDTTYAQQALGENDGLFSMDDLEAAQNGSFTRILDQLNAQSGIQQNLETPQVASVSPDGTRTLYVSALGYQTLFATAPKTLYVPEGQGARTRPANAVVDQVVLHSFGYRIDSMALRAGANSIQIDNRNTGHNPFKVYQRLQQVLFTPRQATTHIITRRGDIISATPWNRAPAVNSGGQAANLRVAERSISIELESWHTAYNVPFRGTAEDRFRVLGLMPYTPEQMTALAFLLRKLGIWSDVDPTNVLGFTYSEASSKLGSAGGHAPGMVNASVIDRAQKFSPSGEFEFPATWVTGDPIPSHLDSSLWSERVRIYYGAFGAGTPISHFNTIKQVYTGLPTYAFETELFETRDNVLFTAAPPATGGIPAVAQEASNNSGAGFARSQAMQQSNRSGLYEAAPVANDAVITATETYSGRMNAQAQAVVATPVIRNALAFDFGTGRWVIATSRLVSPGSTPSSGQPRVGNTQDP
jgi:hypothetical protein